MGSLQSVCWFRCLYRVSEGSLQTLLGSRWVDTTMYLQHCRIGKIQVCLPDIKYPEKYHWYKERILLDVESINTLESKLFFVFTCSIQIFSRSRDIFSFQHSAKYKNSRSTKTNSARIEPLPTMRRKFGAPNPSRATLSPGQVTRDPVLSRRRGH